MTYASYAPCSILSKELIDQNNNILTVLVHNLKTTWSTKIPMPFWSSLDNLLFFFQKGVDNFEIEHKTCLKSIFVRQCENAEYPDAAVSRLLHAYHPASSILEMITFGHVFEENRAARCMAIALGSLWTPRWPPKGRHSTKIIFHVHVTFDLWWLYINVDLRYYHISLIIKIN